MALSNSFGAAAPAFTQSDVEALVAEVDRDPSNMDKVYKFGNALYGQVPFPDGLFKAAKNEMLRRYAEVHMPRAISEEAAAQDNSWARSDGGWTTEDGEDAGVAFARIAQGKRSQMQAAYERFEEIADSNARTLAHVAGEALKAQQQSQVVNDDKNRITAVTAQIGSLTQPVAAPKVAKFRPRGA